MSMFHRARIRLRIGVVAVVAGGAAVAAVTTSVMADGSPTPSRRSEVQGGAAGLAPAAHAAFFGAPAAPLDGRSVTASPAADLADGDIVQVTTSGFGGA